MTKNLYWILALVFALVMLISLLMERRNRPESVKSSIAFRMLLYWTTFLCSQDMFWGFCFSGVIRSDGMYFCSPNSFISPMSSRHFGGSSLSSSSWRLSNLIIILLCRYVDCWFWQKPDYVWQTVLSLFSLAYMMVNMWWGISHGELFFSVSHLSAYGHRRGHSIMQYGNQKVRAGV